jgi:hypothetical protein
VLDGVGWSALTRASGKEAAMLIMIALIAAIVAIKNLCATTLMVRGSIGPHSVRWKQRRVVETTPARQSLLL